MDRTLDQVLAYHCGPALAGLKAANLVSLSREEFPYLEERTAAYGKVFRSKGVAFRILCHCGGNTLLLVFRPELLCRQLRHPLAVRLLARDGYPLEQGLEPMLDWLSRRLGRRGEFPHEIGLFLGYPPEDVEGFQRHRGRGCKLCGYWKVYSDVNRAQSLFRRYDRCRACLCARLAKGMSLPEVFRAA